MKYKVIVVLDGTDCTILTNDGGIATVHHNEDHLITTYYQERINKNTDVDNLFEELEEGKQYLHDWNKQDIDNEIINDAINWLMPNEVIGVDETLYPKELTNELLKAFLL